MISGSPTSNRRSFLQAAGLLGSSALLAGCARGSNSVAGDSAPGGGTITAAGWDDSINDLMDGGIAEGFKAKSGVGLQAQAAVPFSDFQTRFRTLLAGGSPPDVMRLNDDFLPEVSDKSLSKDLVPYFEKSGLNRDDFFPIFDWSKLPSGQKGLVTGTQVRCLFYNKTLFQEEGIPLPPTDWTADGWSWDDFLAAATALTKGTERYGAVIATDTAYEDIWSRNNGTTGTFSDDGTKFTLADPAGVEAIQWVADLTLKHKVQPVWGDLLPDNSVERLFTSGKLGMALHASSSIGYYAENAKDFEWDLAPIPARKHQYQQGGVVVYIIPDKAKNPDQAWDYLNYAISEEGGKLLAEAGLAVPVNKKAAEALKSPGDYPKNIKLLIAGADQNKSINHTLATSAAVSLYRPQLERVYSGEVTAQEALSGIRPQVEAAIAG